MKDWRRLDLETTKMALKSLNYLFKKWVLTIYLQRLSLLLSLLQGMETNIYSEQTNNEESITRNQDAFGYGCKISKNANKEQYFYLKNF